MTEQPIGYKLSVQIYSPGSAHIRPQRWVQDQVYPTMEEARAARHKVPSDMLSCITPVYISARKRNVEHLKRQESASKHWPLQKMALT